MNDTQLGTVLVVGGSGFVGIHVVKRLLSSNLTSSIIITSRNPKPVDDPGIAYEAVDITSKSSVNALFAKIKPTVVIHTVSPLPRAPTKELEATNVMGTQHLLSAATATAETKAFIYASSDSACVPMSWKEIKEDECELYTSKNWVNDYGRTKGIADATVLAANSKSLKTATMRVPLIYGEYDTHLAPTLANTIRKGQHKQQVGPDTVTWEFVYAGSVASAMILAAQALLKGVPGADGQAYFITDGERGSLFDFFRKCFAAAGYPVKKEEIKTVPMWFVQALASTTEWVYWIFTAGYVRPELNRKNIDHLQAGACWNIEKAKKLLGYRPVMEQDDAIKLFMEWAMKEYY